MPRQRENIEPTLEQAAAFLAELQRAGWDPVEPGDECRGMTARPTGLDYLPNEDARGVHWCVIQLALESRFAGGRVPRWRFALLRDRSPLYLSGVDTPAKFEAESRRLAAWEAARLRPSLERLRGAPNQRTTPDEVERDRAKFEPALSFALAVYRAGLIPKDECARREAMELGSVAHETGLPPRKLRRRDVSQVKRTAAPRHDPEALTIAERNALALESFRLLRRGKSGTERRLTRVRDDGCIVVDSEKVRTALDSSFPDTRKLARRNRDQRPAPLPDDAIDAASALGALDAVADVDAAFKVRSVLETRIAAVPVGSARRHVLGVFEALATRELSMAELARRTGLTAPSLREAFESERARIAARIFGG